MPGATLTAPPTLGALGARERGRRNNLDVVRLAAAALVLVSHCATLSGRVDPFAKHGGRDTLGGLGVDVFFAVSGMLVCASFAHDPAPVRYLVRRCLRIFPGLWVSLLVTTFVIGLACTGLGAWDYLTSGGTWSFLVRHAGLDSLSGVLPGVFHGLPAPDAVNGSLWTLPYEFGAYLGVLALGVAGLLNRWVLPALLVAAEVVLLVRPDGFVHGRVYALFLAGACLWAWRDRVRVSWVAGAVLAVLWWLTWDTRLLTAATALFLPYAVLVLGYRTPRWLGVLAKPGDVSYGLYLYAFPLTQAAVVAFGTDLRPSLLVLVVAVSSYACGWLSWKLVEAPALRRKPRRHEPPTGGVAHPAAGRTWDSAEQVAGRAATLARGGSA